MKKNIGLIVDSGCDMTQEMREQANVSLVPLQVIIDGQKHYCDDGTVNLPEMLQAMAKSKSAAKSACPSIGEYHDAIEPFDQCFVVTLSSNLSGSYQAARMATEMVREEFPDKKIHVFDSKTACVGETALFLFLDEHINEGKAFEEIIPLADEFLVHSRTLLVLKDLSNLIKNGRLGKVSGMIASKLSISLILGDDGNGEITLFKKVRGMKKALSGMVDMVNEKTGNARAKSINLVLGHCNCKEQAEWLRVEVLGRCKAIKKVVTVPTGALTSMYAGDGGIVVSFCETT